MGLLDAINNLWQNFLNVFPPEYHAFVASAILIMLIIALISLFMFNPIFFIVALIIGIPILYPILVTFFQELNKILFTSLLLSMPS